MSNISQKHLKIGEKQPKISKIIYIYLYFYGRAPASSRRDLDATERAPENLDPKKRMLGLTPVIFSKVDVAKTHKEVVGDP